mmetsp:Transcript_121750/g.278987  ORF Transcript_121750/g.278987 Transcript_121750/m.278987 type:complete len:166 (-) Transcript_121750:265-762(-)
MINDHEICGTWATQNGTFTIALDGGELKYSEGDVFGTFVGSSPQWSAQVFGPGGPVGTLNMLVVRDGGSLELNGSLQPITGAPPFTVTARKATENQAYGRSMDLDEGPRGQVVQNNYEPERVYQQAESSRGGLLKDKEVVNPYSFCCCGFVTLALLVIILIFAGR